MSNAVLLDEAVCWDAVTRRDAASDGQFFLGVLTTGVYCRPSCPARHPLRKNVRFYREPAQAERDGCQVAQSKEAFFATADVLSLHLRLNDATRAIVTAADLALMKPSALLVNASRAELIAAGALQAALEHGRPGFAALDVFEQEPLTPDSPLLRMENMLATPHLGYVEQNSYELYFRAAFENIVNFADGKPSGLLNQEVVQKTAKP